MKERAAVYAYFLVGSTNLIGQLLGNESLMEFTKPVLMPVLMYFVFISTRGKVTRPILLLNLGLIFSWLGDILLMNSAEMYFLLGLGAFLITQILYSIVMKQSSFKELSFQVKPLLPILLYGFILLYLLVPAAGDFRIPIAVYALCILVMISMARLRLGKTSDRSFKLVFVGAAVFVLSDSFIAIDKFVQSFPQAGFLIMATYIVAQYLIVKGILVHQE
jgi:uncharacterized membrane protein YhhN